MYCMVKMCGECILQRQVDKMTAPYGEEHIGYYT